MRGGAVRALLLVSVVACAWGGRGGGEGSPPRSRSSAKRLSKGHDLRPLVGLPTLDSSNATRVRAACWEWVDARREYFKSEPGFKEPLREWTSTADWRAGLVGGVGEHCDVCCMATACEGVHADDGAWILALCGGCAIDFMKQVGGNTTATYRRCVRCTKWAVFGSKDVNRARSCAAHRKEGEVDVVHRRCWHEGCSKIPAYGKESDRTPSYCKAHKPEEYVLVSSRRCQHPEGCRTWPGFGDASERVPRFCQKHKKKEHVDLLNKKCEESGCGKQAAFGDARQGSFRFCAAHRDKAAHVDLKKFKMDLKGRNTRCSSVGCSTYPVFGEAGGQPLFCKRHKLPHHVDVKNKKCSAPGCQKQPIFGKSGGRAQNCEMHRQAGHVNVFARTCAKEGCSARAAFGLRGANETFCGQHKKDGHIDVLNLKCAHYSGCDKRPSWAEDGSKTPRFCRAHKGDGHVNVRLLKEKITKLKKVAQKRQSGAGSV